MKKIEAIIRQEQLERVKMLLATLGYHGMTIAEVSGVGKQKGFDEAVKFFILLGAFILFMFLLYHFFGPGTSGGDF